MKITSIKIADNKIIITVELEKVSEHRCDKEALFDRIITSKKNSEQLDQICKSWWYDKDIIICK